MDAIVRRVAVSFMVELVERDALQIGMCDEDTAKGHGAVTCTRYR